ncbi:MAG: TetR/AcrR family transcriptional regulator [Candidatus Baltobacteraceae bacterium]
MLPQTAPARSSPEETRCRILAATRALFAKKGRRGTTTREIAELAGVNEATLFRHFGHKDTLIEACAQHYCQAEHLQEFIQNLTGDIESDLHAIAQALYERLNQVRDMIVMSLAEEEADSAVETAAWRAPMAIHTMVRDYMTRRVENGELQGDPLLMTRLFLGMIFARVIGRKKFPDEQYTQNDLIDFQVNVFLNGVRKKK